MTEVINIKQAPPGWKKDSNYVYIGRGSKWGNQYSHLSYGKAEHKVNTRDEACDCFEQHQLPGLLDQVHELKGKTLVCYCAPLRCHGHSLAIAADAT
jgi:hypothetical protein